jgi:hypothetical protein
MRGAGSQVDFGLVAGSPMGGLARNLRVICVVGTGGFDVRGVAWGVGVP